MPLWGEIVIGVVVAIGLLGTIVQVLPGATVVGAAVALWGAIEGGRIGWTVFGVALGLTVAAWVLQYLVPGRYMRERGVPGATLIIGLVVGVVGFVVIPVMGLFLGFVAGVFVAEWVRLRDAGAAWPATVSALKAAGLSILVELGLALLITATWVAGLIFT